MDGFWETDPRHIQPPENRSTTTGMIFQSVGILTNLFSINCFAKTDPCGRGPVFMSSDVLWIGFCEPVHAFCEPVHEEISRETDVSVSGIYDGFGITTC